MKKGDCTGEHIVPPRDIIKTKGRAARMDAGGTMQECAASVMCGPGRGAARGRTRGGLSISTASIYKPRLDGGGRRILVTRYYPRGVRRSHFDDWLRELAPSRELLRGYKEGSVAWKAFAGAFLAEVRGSDEAQSALRGLRRAARRGGGITLLCFEPDGAHCHRHILRELVERPRRLPWPRTLEPDCTDYHNGVPAAGLASD